MRALASALFLFINNLLGFASDRLAAHFGAASLRIAILGGTGRMVGGRRHWY